MPTHSEWAQKGFKTPTSRSVVFMVATGDDNYSWVQPTMVQQRNIMMMGEKTYCRHDPNKPRGNSMMMGPLGTTRIGSGY